MLAARPASRTLRPIASSPRGERARTPGSRARPCTTRTSPRTARASRTPRSPRSATWTRGVRSRHVGAHRKTAPRGTQTDTSRGRARSGAHQPREVIGEDAKRLLRDGEVGGAWARQLERELRRARASRRRVAGGARVGHPDCDERGHAGLRREEVVVGGERLVQSVDRYVDRDDRLLSQRRDVGAREECPQRQGHGGERIGDHAAEPVGRRVCYGPMAQLPVQNLRVVARVLVRRVEVEEHAARVV